ncbi:MAG: hypothetical protein HYY09_03895 [Firmicutes bacterium]|nr:hypothetical protein [Bacillota bacterium]
MNLGTYLSVLTLCLVGVIFVLFFVYWRRDRDSGRILDAGHGGEAEG